MTHATRHSPRATFPSTRMRRMRASAWRREILSEHRLHPSDLVWPVFIQDGKDKESIVQSMPGVSRITLDILKKRIKSANQLGLRALALFPSVDKSLKTECGKEALNKNNLVCRAIKEIKNALPEIGVIADVALDPYTSHGHDGIVARGGVANDATVEILSQQALILAKAGCDVVAPSDMMDGRVAAIRAALESEGFHDTMILAYAAKYASCFYGPFRDAVGSATALGKADKKTYQMDPANADEAMREIALDIEEGADMVMIKPGLPYLDIIHRAASTFGVPVLAYQVSGEYAQIKAAAEKGWLDGDAAMLESLLCLKRAGARAIFTYAACEVAHLIQK